MSKAPEKSGDASPLIRLENVHKTYRIGKAEVRAVRGVTMEVRLGEVLCIQGASGAGKSTLLHVAGSLDTPTSGRVFYAGEDVYAMSEYRRTGLRCRRLGFVFQSYHLLPELTVLENVVLPSLSTWGGLRRYRATRDRAETLLRTVGLADRLLHRPMELSGGEQQRAALARALINDPDVVLADEPTGNLDSRTGEVVLDLLFQLVQERRRTLVLVTHNREVAERCDRNLVLQDGQIE